MNGFGQAKTETPTRKGSRRQRLRRRAGRPVEARSTSRVLDVYGTVTGNGSARPTTEIEESILDALR